VHQNLDIIRITEYNMVNNFFKRGFQMSFMSSKQAGKLWNISARRVAVLCKEGRIPGAQLVGKSWVVPEGTHKPVDARIKSGKYIKSKVNRVR
jgi:hypothetical protein